MQPVNIRVVLHDAGGVTRTKKANFHIVYGVFNQRNYSSRNHDVAQMGNIAKEYFFNFSESCLFMQNGEDTVSAFKEKQGELFFDKIAHRVSSSRSNFW